MFDAFRKHVSADIPDETITLIVMQAKQGGVHRYEDIGSMKIYEGNLLVVEGRIPEFSGLTRLNEVAPPMEQTLAKIDILNEQRDRVVQQNALLREHELAQARSYGGPSRSASAQAKSCAMRALPVPIELLTASKNHRPRQEEEIASAAPLRTRG